MSGKHYTFAQQVCIKKSGLALQKASPLYEGSRVGVAFSGGLDSFILLKVLQIRRKIVSFNFEIMVLHCNPGFEPQNHLTLVHWLENEGLPSHFALTDFGLKAHSPENKKGSPCFLCSWLRRKLMFELCEKYRLTHLAIGHNADDLTDTFLLNILKNGRVEGLPIGEDFFGGKLRVIRPLLLVEKKYIRQASRQWNLPIVENPCPSSGHTMRSKISEILAKLDRELPGARRSALNALTRWQLKKESIEK